MHNIFRLYLSISLLALASAAQAQKAEWTEVIYSMEVRDDQSVKEVKGELLKIARQKAVENISGINVSTASLSNDAWEVSGDDNNFFQSFKVLSNVSSQGLIVEENEPVYTKLENDHQKITYKAKVAKPTATNDPGFSLTVEMNKKVFQIGEELKLTVNCTKNAFLTIFAIYEDEKAGVIFPSKGMKDNQLKALQPRIIPNASEDPHFEMLPSPDGLEKYSEVLLFVITKKEVLFQQLENDVNYNATWLDINQWLMKIPSDQRAVAYSQYQVMGK